MSNAALKLETAQAPGIEISDVYKNFGQTKVLKGADLSIRPGEFLVLLGPSGCGKTTLLRIISGLELPSGGHIRIDGKDVTTAEPKERDVAMVFQSYALYPHMNVRNNMAFSLQIARMPKDEINRRVAQASEILGLDQLLERFPRELSGGQRQRVAMGRAIVRSPGVFLFDEPLSNLDAKLRVHMRSEIKDLHERLNTTSVYVTHDQIEAMTMADRIVIMNGGQIEQVGTPLEVFDQPANLFVAGFIGSPAMNFLPARVKTTGGTASGVLKDGQALALPAQANLTDGQDITIGIRPHNLVLGEGGLRMTVQSLQQTGIETLILADLAGSEVLIQTTQRFTGNRGDVLNVHLNTDDIHVFDTASGQRIDEFGRQFS